MNIICYNNLITIIFIIAFIYLSSSTLTLVLCDFFYTIISLSPSLTMSATVPQCLPLSLPLSSFFIILPLITLAYLHIQYPAKCAKHLNHNMHPTNTQIYRLFHTRNGTFGHCAPATKRETKTPLEHAQAT